MNHFSISLMTVQDYCEYQLYLRCYKGVRAAPTWQMLHGTKKHAQLEERFLEKAEPLTVPLEEQIRLTLKGLDDAFSVREIRLESKQYKMRGKADEIMVSQEAGYVIDDKPRLTEGAKNQVRAYCLAFQEQFGFEKPLYSVVRDRDSQDIAWQEPYDDPAQHHVKKIIARVWDILNGCPGNSSDNPNKCRACRYRYACDRSLC